MIHVSGINSSGELGVEMKPAEPFQTIPNDTFSSPVKKIQCGSLHTLFLCEDGNVYFCGENETLGIGQCDKPRQILREYGPIEQIVSGEYHVLCVTQNGVVLAGGSQTYYNCGLGTTEATPFIIHPTLNDSKLYPRVSVIFSGANTTAYTSIHGDVYFAGRCKNGSIGSIDNDTTSSSSSSSDLSAKLFTKLQNFNQPVKQIALGYSHTILLTNNGQCFALGMDDSGQCGLPHKEKRVGHIPTQIHFHDDARIIDVKCGNNHTIFLDKDHTVYFTGNNFHGESAFEYSGNTTIRGPKISPLVQNVLLETKVRSIYCGAWHSILVTNENDLIVCGYNSRGMYTCIFTLVVVIVVLIYI
jgi:alpha-tubulin suppressor-like RCC1 family protein